MTRPFRFGVQALHVPSRTVWLDLSRRVEDAGYAVLTVPDHFWDLPAPGIALAMAAAVTERLRVGALVWSNDYRHPVVLAKELATLDLLSEGRLEIGLGTGWERDDYDRAGMRYDPAGVRVDRMLEGLRVLRGVMGAEPFSFAGDHYRITELTGTPRPVQQPHPPILIGGGGRRVLSIAGREADIAGVNLNLGSGVMAAEAWRDGTAGAVERKVGWVRDAAEAAGRPPPELHLRMFHLHVTDDADGALAEVSAATGLSPAEAAASPYVLAGSVPALVDQLQALRARWGFSYVTVGAPQAAAFAPVVAALSGH